MHVAQIDLAGTGHSLQGVATRRRSRSDPAVDARFPQAGTRAARDQRPFLPAVSVGGQDRVGDRPRRVRRPRLLGVRDRPSRAMRSSPTRRRSTSIATTTHRSCTTIPRTPTASTCGRRCALERRRRLVADRDRRRASRVPVYRDDNHFDGELDPGGPEQLLERQGVGRRDDGANGDRLVAGSADADAVHGGCARRQRRDAAVGSRGRPDSRLRRVRRAQSRRRRLDDDGDGGSRHGAASIVNTSSDNPLGRVVATSLAVFASRR